MRAVESDTFQDFPTSLMSIGNTSDDGNISIFTKDNVKHYQIVWKEFLTPHIVLEILQQEQTAAATA